MTYEPADEHLGQTPTPAEETGETRYSPVVEAVDTVTPVATQPKPRAWPVILTWFIALSAGLGGTIAMGIVIGIIHALSGSEPDALFDRLNRDPIINLMLIVPMQAAFLLAALFYPLVSKRTTKDLLGVGRPSLGPAGWLLIIAGAPVPFIMGVVMAIPMPSMMDEQMMAELWAGMSAPVAMVWVLFLGLSPGFAEELLFRGLIQRRLMLRYGPAWAIGISSVLFAVSHLDPAQSTFALPLGVWFGLIAWRTGSIWLTIVAHMLVNMTSSTIAILTHQNIVSEVVVGVFVIGLLLVGLVCFSGSMVVLFWPAKRLSVEERVTPLRPRDI